MREQLATRTKITTYLQTYAELWRGLDEIFSSLHGSDWQKRHGPDWVMADLPYHLSYFDDQVMVLCIERGRDISQSERWSMASLTTINAWNARNFARKPKDQAVARSLDQMHTSRNALRALLEGKSDDQLVDPTWSAFSGWTTLDDVIRAGIAHTWNHFNELRLRLKRDTPVLSADTNRMALTFYMTLLQAFADTEKAGPRPFTLGMDFGDCGAWTIDVRAGKSSLNEGIAPQADLVMRQEPAAFTAMLTKAENPIMLIMTRKIRVKGFRNMSRFGKIFAEPAPDADIFPFNEVEPSPAQMTR